MNIRPSFTSPTFFVASAIVLLTSACGDDGIGATGAGTETGDETSAEAETSSSGTDTGDGDGDPTGDGDGDGDPTGDGDGDPTGDGDGDPTGDGDGDPDPGNCFDEPFINGESPGPDYSEFPVPLGSHCQGTNNQDITEIERVVFIGDSVTVGSPPTPTQDFYRAILADQLAAKYGIQAPDILWKTADPFSGQSINEESGDFASCAKWGARNDDLLTQLEDCFDAADYDKRTLVIWTMGGNDASSIAQNAVNGASVAELFAQSESMEAHHHDALDWLVGDPNKFPNGVFVVNANVYEFTDFTGDLLSCPASGLAGFDANPPNRALLVAALTAINKFYMEEAEAFGTDLVFMFEGYCGHGFHSDDPSNVCYRGPDQDNWFDLTCIHPTPTGHHALADMFFSVISE